MSLFGRSKSTRRGWDWLDDSPPRVLNAEPMPRQPPPSTPPGGVRIMGGVGRRDAGEVPAELSDLTGSARRMLEDVTDLVCCPKCRGDMDHVRWMPVLDGGRCGHRDGPDGATICPYHEHLHRDCSTCGYGRWEHCADDLERDGA